MESSLDTALAENAGAITVFYSVIVLIGLVVDAALVARLQARPVDWRRHLNMFYWRPFGDREALLLSGLLAALFAGIAAVVEPLRDAITGAGWEPDTVLVFVQSFTFHWAGVAAVFLWLKWKGIPWTSAFGMRWRELPHRAAQGLMFLLATMPVLVFYTIIYGLYLQAAGESTSQQDVAYAMSETTSPLAKAYFFFLAVALAPFFEEILFRGVVMTALAKRIGAGAAIVITSLFFALMHGHVPSVVPLFILSVGLSMAYLFTGSLLVPMCMHSLFNLVSVTWLFQAL